MTSADPRALAAIARTRTPALPHLGPAVHRHLQELPSSVNGLSLTQSLLLQILAREPASVGDLWRVSQGELEPMPFLGDTMFLHILNQMGRAHPAVYERSAARSGTSVQRSPCHYPRPAVRYSRARPTGTPCNLPLRWLGGVRMDPSTPNWRWDEARQDVTMA